MDEFNLNICSIYLLRNVLLISVYSFFICVIVTEQSLKHALRLPPLYLYLGSWYKSDNINFELANFPDFRVKSAHTPTSRATKAFRLLSYSATAEYFMTKPDICLSLNYSDFGIVSTIVNEKQVTITENVGSS